jgi:hypothetical protein
MPHLSLRWSEHEARKPYARPFGVGFAADDGSSLGAIAVSGADLLYYRQFQVAVLTLGGELFLDPAIDSQADPQRAWLDRLTELLPAAGGLRLRPVSSFDHERGRIFHIEADLDGRQAAASLEAAVVFEYQDLQAALAHQTGSLFRDRAVEAVADPAARQAAWLEALAGLVERPPEQEAMTVAWPWRASVPG